jgi:hypothetical protein
MFRASSCLSSGATKTAVAASGLPSELGNSNAVGCDRAGRPARPRTTALVTSTYKHRRKAGNLRIGNKTFEAVQSFQYLENNIGNTNNNNK